MATYLCIHKHQNGTDTRLFRTPDSYQAAEVFNRRDEEGQIAFAEAVGINYEPGLDEELTIEFINLDDVDEFLPSDFTADGEQAD